MIEIKNDSLDKLADDLIEKLSQKRSLLDNYIVVFPNLILEQWFKSYWIKKTENVLMDVKFMRLNSLIEFSFDLKDKKLFNKLDSSILINEILSNNEYLEFKDYLKNDNLIFDLSNNLSNIFDTYNMESFIPKNDELKILNEIKNKYNYVMLSDLLDSPIKNKAKVFVFGFVDIKKGYLDLLNRLDSYIYIQNVKNDLPKINNICSAYSKEREIEYVYSEICKIFKENSLVKTSDILVYGVNISDYECQIKKVFNETNNVFIKASVLSNNNELSNTGEAINVLYKILENKTFTRLDFYKLINNPTIQKSRKINKDCINKIILALDKMNVYRESLTNNIDDDFIYAIRRLLLSKIVGKNDLAKIDDKLYEVYESINLDDYLIKIIIDIIDDIYSFINKFDLISLDELKLELDKWLSYKNEVEETNYYYNKLIKIIDFINVNKLNLTKELIFKLLINEAKNINSYPNNIINEGITFLELNENFILSSKYMFFIGMSNNLFPRKNVSNPFDQRTDIMSNLDKDKRLIKLLDSNSKNKYYSYTNQNLVSGEKYEITPLLLYDELKQFEYYLTVDKPYNELYSKTEFFKKNYNIHLYKEKPLKEEKILEQRDLPKNVKLKDLAEFLNENLMSKADNLFKQYDIINKDSLKEYNITLDHLRKSFITKDLIKELLINDDKEQVINQIYDKYKINHTISYFKEDIIDEFNESNKIVKKIKELDEYKIIDEFDVSINDFILNVSNEFVVGKKNDILNVYLIKSKKYDKDHLNSYLMSLAYSIKYDYEGEVVINGVDKYKYYINKEEAYRIINNIYNLYVDYDFMLFTPISEVKNENYQDVLGEKNFGISYDDKILFDLHNMFNEDSFELWKCHRKFIFDNVLYIKEDKKDE